MNILFALIWSLTAVRLFCMYRLKNSTMSWLSLMSLAMAALSINNPMFFSDVSSALISCLMLTIHAAFIAWIMCAVSKTKRRVKPLRNQKSALKAA